MNKQPTLLRNLIRKGDSIFSIVLAKLALHLVRAEKVGGLLPDSVYELPKAS